MSASKSPKVVKSQAKPVKKYASRHVGELLQSLIDEHLKKTKKNPNATAKWMSKMKLSIQRKVSQYSKIVYQTPGDNVESLKAEISDLKLQINQRLTSIKDKNIKAINSTNYTQPNLGDLSPAIQQGSYEHNTKNIVEKYRAIANQLSTATKHADSRFNTFSATLKTVNNNLQPVLAGLKQRATAIVGPSFQADEPLYFDEGYKGKRPINNNSMHNNNNNNINMNRARKNSPIRVDHDKDDAAIDKLLEHLEGSN